MKAIIIIWIFNVEITFSQWDSIYTGYDNYFRTIFFIDSVRGWIGSLDGTILRTTDSGNSWESSTTSGGINSIYFLNADTGFCSTENSLFRTINGGEDWQQIFTGQYMLFSIDFVSEDIGFVVGTDYTKGIVLKTEDGGFSWTQNIYPNEMFFRSIKMLDELNGFIAGGWEKIWKTTDGGITWNEIFNGWYGHSFDEIVFTDSLNGFVYGSHFYKTYNGGNSWESISLPVIYYQSISTFENNCWLLVNSWFSRRVVYSSDYGNTWNPILQLSGNQFYAQDIFFVDNHNGWICGRFGTLLKTTNRGFSTIPIPNQPLLYTPKNDTLIYAAEPFFIWSEDDFAFYHIQIDTDSSFSNPSTDKLLLGNVYTENLLEPFQRYFWRVRGENLIGNSIWSEIASFITGELVSVDNETEIPKEFSLSQNYPNPFNPATKIKFSLPSVIANEVKQSQLVSLKVYDVLGSEVAILVDEELPAGEYEVEFNPESSIKHPASGIYFYQMRVGSFVQTKKMILLR